MSSKWKLVEVNVDEVEFTEVNANRMSQSDFDKLVNNIRTSGLSSVIACYRRKDDGKYVIISGNHRFRACLKLGYTKINILYADEQDMSHDEIVALQLSHNSLHGDDDRAILKRLMDEIKDIDFKEFAHIQIDDIDVDDMFSGSIVPMSEHYSVSLVLYKKDKESIEELMSIVEDNNKVNDMVILADGEKNEKVFLEMISDIKKDFDIKSSSIAFSKLLELAKAGYGTLGTDDVDPEEFSEIQSED